MQFPTLWHTAGGVFAKGALALEETLHRALTWPWTLPLLVIAIAVALFATLVRAHRRWKKGWLSGLIAIRLAAARARRPPARTIAAPLGLRGGIAAMRLVLLEGWDRVLVYFGGQFLNDLKRPRFPSVVSLALISIVVALFFIVPRPPSLSIAWHSRLRDWVSGLTADLAAPGSKLDELIVGAFTGLAVVIIALVVFVAESIRDDSDDERKRVLVNSSWLWPLAVTTTLIPFGFLWSTARGMTVLLEAIVAFVTLLAFYNVLRSLLDPDTRAKNRFALLRSRIRTMLFDSVRERIGNSMLLDQLGTGKPIDALHYTISRTFIEDDAQGYVFVDAPKDGWLSDIQLDELAKLANRLDRRARELGIGLRESGPRREAGAAGAVQQVQGEALPVRKAYLLKRYREEIPPDSIFYGKQRALLALPPAFAKDPTLLADVGAAIPHIFRFSKEEPSSVLIRREMQGTKDQLVQAIREQALGAIDDLRQTYLQIAEEFLTLLVEFGGGYTAEQARKERGNVFQSWSEIQWLLSDLRELIIIATDAGNTDVLGKIAFLPFAIASRSVQVRDHFLFQQFYQFAIFLYVLAAEEEAGSRIRGWMTERCWRWPKEITEFYVGPELAAKPSKVAELEQMRDFALYSLRVFQDVMRLMADKRDVTAFMTVAHQCQKLYKRFREEDDQPNAALLRLQLGHAQHDVQRSALQDQLTVQEKRGEVAAALDLAIDEVFLALGGRVLAQRLARPADREAENSSTSSKRYCPTH